MLDNRYTALVDACSLVGALGRNTLLSLADADLFRVRWSDTILEETERALVGMFEQRGDTAPGHRASVSIQAMRDAFPEARVAPADLKVMAGLGDLRDPDDAHVIGAAISCGAAVIVTENVRDFQLEILETLSIEVKTADRFIADIIDLDRPRAAVAISTMRERLRRPPLSVDELLLTYETRGFFITGDLLGEMRALLR